MCEPKLAYIVMPAGAVRLALGKIYDKRGRRECGGWGSVIELVGNSK